MCVAACGAGRRSAVISLAHALDAGYTQQSVAPYHNNIHGADVIQALCYFIQAHLHERLVRHVTQMLSHIAYVRAQDICGDLALLTRVLWYVLRHPGGHRDSCSGARGCSARQ